MPDTDSDSNDGTGQNVSNPLADAIAAHAISEDMRETAIPGLSVIHRSHPTEPSTNYMPPSLCLIGQGAKCVVLGDSSHIYDDRRYLVTSVDLPVTAQVIKASPQKPYLGLTLTLDFTLIAGLMLETPPPAPEPLNLGVTVSELVPPLMDAFVRLLGLLDSPGDIPALSPLILKEIYYRLLVGEQGSRLRQIVSGGNGGSRVFQVINWLKEHFREKFLVNDYASRFGMSPSSLYQHFKSLTALSPIQYQKKLRLIEARRLMLVDGLQIADAAFQVGYESPSQFTREYSRLFGAPPRDDLKFFKQSIPMPTPGAGGLVEQS
jgi:AraC-like DNA-binding protein